MVGHVFSDGHLDAHPAHRVDRDRLTQFGTYGVARLGAAIGRWAVDEAMRVGGEAVLAVIRAEPVALPIERGGGWCVFDLDLHSADRVFGVAAGVGVAVAVEPVDDRERQQGQRC